MGPFFVPDQQLIDTRKEAALQQRVWFEHEMTAEIYAPICEFIAQGSNQPLSSFSQLAMNLAEDVIIHRKIHQHDWMAAAHLCLPSSWWPEEKIGKPLREIHAPIPGMNLDLSSKLVDTMINHGPFERFVWSIIYEPRYNFHPSLPRKEFDSDTKEVFIKVERQMTVGFPQVQASLFILRQELILPHEIIYRELYQACKNMSPDERTYKGVTQALIEFLHEHS
jgi:hypothetical protein